MQMNGYHSLLDHLLARLLPDLHAHFTRLGFRHYMYFNEWYGPTTKLMLMLMLICSGPSRCSADRLLWRWP